MQVKQIENVDIPSYDQFISDNNGSFLQSFAWGQWQKQNGRKVWRHTIQDNEDNPVPLADSGTGQTHTEKDGQNNQIKINLAAQVIQHSLPMGNCYLYVPYGPVAQLTVDSGQCNRAIQALLDHMRAEFPNAVFVRLEPTQSLPLQLTTYNLQPSLHIQPGSTILLDIHNSTEELLAGMHPKTRYNIKVAERHGVQIIPLDSSAAQLEAATLFADTLVRRKLASPPASYYAHLLASKDLAVSGLGAYYNNQLIACGLFVDFGHTRTYLFGGSSTEHKNVMAPYLLHWTAIQNAKQKGFRIYDFFGAEGSVSDGSGFARFKQGFGGTTTPYAGTVDVILKPLHYRAYQLLRTLNRWIKHI